MVPGLSRARPRAAPDRRSGGVTEAVRLFVERARAGRVGLRRLIGEQNA